MKVKVKESRAYGQISRGRDMEVLQEAVENIIPPAFDKIVDFCKNPQEYLGMDEVASFSKGAQDVLAKYISAYGLLNFYEQSRHGNKPGPIDIGKIFYRALTVPVIAEQIEDLIWRMSETDDEGNKDVIDKNKFTTQDERYAERMRLRKARVVKLIKPYEQLRDNFRTNREWNQSGLTDDRGISAVDQWEAQFMNAMGHESRGFNVVPRRNSAGAVVDQETQQAFVILGQQYKSHMKMLKKFLKKHPLGKTPVADDILKRVLADWDNLQSRWIFNELFYKFNEMITYMSQDDSLVGKFDAFFRDNPYGIEHYPQTTAYERSLSPRRKPTSLELVNDYIDNEKIKRQYKPCEDGWNRLVNTYRGDEYPDGQNACVLKVYENGKFWWNRDQSSCELAGDEMANCGSSNNDDSVLLILKEKIGTDELNENEEEPTINLRDKVKSRIMVEFNPRSHTLVQILGFGNSFPNQEHWTEIKDLYENLEQPTISKGAFTHLNRSGRTTEDEIKAFMEFMQPEDEKPENQPPKSFFGNTSDAMLHRIQQKMYNNEWESNEEGENFGRTYTYFSAKHHQMSKEGLYQILLVRLGVTALIPAEYDTINGEKWRQTGTPLQMKAVQVMENMLHAKFSILIDDALRNIEPLAGAVGDVLPEVEIQQIRFPRLRSTPSTQIGLKARVLVKIRPEWFTDESLDEDVPDGEQLFEIVRGILRKTKDERMVTAAQEVLKDWYEEMSSGAPTYPDEPEGSEDKYSDEIYQDRMIQRWMVRRESTSSAERRRWRQLHGAARRRMVRFIDAAVDRTDGLDADEEAELEVLLDFFYDALPSDYQNTVDMARNHDEDFGGEDDDARDGEYIEYRGADSDDPIDRLLETGQRLLRYYAQDESRLGNLQYIFALKRSMEFHGIWEQWWSRVADDHPLKELDEPLLDPDGPDEEERNWRPGMPTPGLRQTDYEDPADIERDQARPVNFDDDTPVPAWERRGTEENNVFRQANMLLRHFQNLGRFDGSVGGARLFDRTRYRLKNMGIWDQWVDTIDDNDPLWNDEAFVDFLADGLDLDPDTETMQEARNIVNKILGEKNSGVVRVRINEGAVEEGWAQKLGMAGGIALGLMGSPDVQAGDTTPTEKAPTAQQVETEYNSYDILLGLLDGHVENQPLEDRADENLKWAKVLEALSQAGQGDTSALKSLTGENAKLLDILEKFVEERADNQAFLDKYGKRGHGMRVQTYGNLEEGEVVDFQTGQETTVDEHFLDFLEEKIPTLDVEDPAQVMAVIRAIENSDSAEQVFNKLEQQGLVTRHMDSAYETTMHQIQQIQSIMTSHWFTRMDQMDSRPPPNMPNGAPMTSHLNENVESSVTTLRVFDFDETIAFTKAETRVNEPSGRVVKLADQGALDKYFYEKGKELKIANPEDPSQPPTSKHIEDALTRKGYELDFSDFSKVREPKENEPVISIIRRMLASYDSDPRGVVYVVTARSQASEGPIKAYLDRLGIEIDRDKIIGVTGGSKKQEIERLMSLYTKDGETTINKIEFFDDSDKNLADVRQLKTEYPQINTILRKVDHENIKTVKEQKRKLLKVRIGAR